jgi:hypothetical protein
MAYQPSLHHLTTSKNGRHGFLPTLRLTHLLLDGQNVLAQGISI